MLHRTLPGSRHYVQLHCPAAVKKVVGKRARHPTPRGIESDRVRLASCRRERNFCGPKSRINISIGAEPLVALRICSMSGWRGTVPVFSGPVYSLGAIAGGGRGK